MGGICYKIHVSLLERIATANYKVDEHSHGSAVMVIMRLEVKWVKVSHLQCDLRQKLIAFKAICKEC